jgi:hypothetical protein
MNFEDDLRRALRREAAPPDFAARVLARTRQPRRFPLAIAAAVLIAVLIPPGIYRYHQHQKATEARDQLLAALSITSNSLQHVQQQIQHNTRPSR